VKFALVAVLALAAQVAGCRTDAPQTAVQHQAVARLVATDGSVDAQSAAAVVESAQSVLRESDATRDVDISVERAVEGPDAHPQIRVVVWRASLRSHLPDIDFAPFDVTVTRSLADEPAAMVDTAAIELLASRVAALLASRLGNGSDLVDLLAADDATSRMFALREVERRRYAAAREAVLGGLDGERPVEFVAAVGALLAIGSEADAETIIEKLPLRDAELVLAVIPALHRLGGRVVTGLLQTLATAHDSADVRARARELLDAR
jgi:hypothetical protein